MKALWENNVAVIETPGTGSEDFAFVANRVPSVGIHLSAGDSKEGYEYNLHHPKAVFDEEVLWIGAASYAYVALQYLQG